MILFLTSLAYAAKIQIIDEAEWIVPNNVNKVRFIYTRPDGSIIIDREIKTVTGEKFVLRIVKE